MSNLSRVQLKLLFVASLVVSLLSLHPKRATASCYNGSLEDCSAECYDQVYCDAIACFQASWAHGGNGQECCFYNTSARFCGSGCPLFCAEP
jgi:hypothetical protein